MNIIAMRRNGSKKQNALVNHEIRDGKILNGTLTWFLCENLLRRASFAQRNDRNEIPNYPRRRYRRFR